MRTARSLTVSHRKNHTRPPEKPRMPPRSNHTPPHPWEQPHMPPLGATMHAPLGATTHPPEQPHTPPGATMHPRATTHAPPSNHACHPQPPHPWSNHTCPQSNHACPPPRATTHTPLWTECRHLWKHNLRKLRLGAVKISSQMIPVRSESFKPCKFHIGAVANSNGGNRLKWLSHNHITPLPFGNRCVTQHIVRMQTQTLPSTMAVKLFCTAMKLWLRVQWIVMVYLFYMGEV